MENLRQLFKSIGLLFAVTQMDGLKFKSIIFEEIILSFYFEELFNLKI